MKDERYDRKTRFIGNAIAWIFIALVWALLIWAVLHGDGGYHPSDPRSNW